MAFETRPYFVAGDLIGCLVAGVAASLATWSLTSWVLPGNWPMVATMPVTMGVGMVVGLGVGAALVPLFGMESMPPAMTTGMTAGMFSGMFAHLLASGDVRGEGLARISSGALLGAAVFVVMYVLNGMVSGEDRRWKT